MKIVRNIFLGLAFASLALVLSVFLVFRSATDFLDDNQTFAERFIHDLSEDWRVDDVFDRVTASFIQSVQSPQGRRLITGLDSFGKLEELYDFEMGSYKATPSATTGTIVAKARFTNATALVTVTLREKNGILRVHGFNLAPVEPVVNPLQSI